MLGIIRSFWPLFLGMLLLMLGNGMQGTIVGVRGAIVGFSPFAMSIILSGYFIGCLIGARITPTLIRRVGHVRVFAAYASLCSAAFLMFAIFPYQPLWFVLRMIIGMCIIGTFIVAEGWLNNAAPNETRGQTLSIYLVAQLLGYMISQGMLRFAVPDGYGLFILGATFMSLALVMLVLSPAPPPKFKETKPMKISRLWQVTPFAAGGVFLMGGMFAGVYGLPAVYGVEKGLSFDHIGIFIGALYAGGLIVQYPMGWLSDRMNRRLLIVITVFIGAIACGFGAFIGNDIVLLSSVAFIFGAAVNPLYMLYNAYTNDFLENEEMAGACGALGFMNGCGAIAGSVILGWLITTFGADAYFMYMTLLLTASGLYGLYSMTQKSAVIITERPYYAVGMPKKPLRQHVRNEEKNVVNKWLDPSEAPRKTVKTKKQIEIELAEAEAWANMAKNWF